MGKPIQTEYKPEDPRVATFRITHGKWEKFQEICKGQNRSASDAILSFIDSVIGGDSIPESKGDFPDIEAMVKAQVSEAIANLPKPEPADLDSIKLDYQALAREEINRALEELPKPEPVDIKSEVSPMIEAAIANLNEQIIGLMEEVDGLKKLEPLG